MLIIKNADAIEKMRIAGRLVEDTFEVIAPYVKEGVTTAEIDRRAHDFIVSQGAYPSSLHFEGYPKSICISVNDTIVHGIPGKYKLKEGDIVSCDIVAEKNGYHGDATRTYLVGEVAPRTKELVLTAREAFFEALKYCRVGYHVQDISRAVQTVTESKGFGVVREFIGHGIGREMHEDPEIPNYVNPRMGRGTKLMPGMCIAIEPMITEGRYTLYVESDGWTAKTRDGKPAAHYENTVLITEGDPEILTEHDNSGAKYAE